MSFNLINPYFLPPGFVDMYSMGFSGVTSSSNLNISGRTNLVDTQLRSANPTFSISCWIKPLGTQDDAGGYGAAIFSKYNNTGGLDRNFYMTLHSNNTIELYGTHNGSTGLLYRVTTDALTTGLTTWYHIAFTYDCNQTTADMITKLYINGASASSWSTNTVATTNKFFYNQATEGSRGYVTWGAAPNISSFFRGRIDEASFWNTALTSTEITQLYNGGTPISASGISSYSSYCVSYWQMGDAAQDIFQTNVWNIRDTKSGGPTTNLTSSNLTLLSRVEEAPPNT